MTFMLYSFAEMMGTIAALTELQWLVSTETDSFGFLSKLEAWNVLSWPVAGIGPSRSLLEMLNRERKWRFSNATGIAPVRWLLNKSSPCRFVRLQIVGSLHGSCWNPSLGKGVLSDDRSLVGLHLWNYYQDSALWAKHCLCGIDVVMDLHHK